MIRSLRRPVSIATGIPPIEHANLRADQYEKEAIYFRNYAETTAQRNKELVELLELVGGDECFRKTHKELAEELENTRREVRRLREERERDLLILNQLRSLISNESAERTRKRIDKVNLINDNK